MKKFILRCSFIFFSISAAAQTQPGSLDENFGIQGKIITDVGGVSNSTIKMQADGKIIVAGTSDSIFLVRYNASGLLDSSFGKNGLVKFALEGVYGLQGINILSDGKIFIIGKYSTGSPYKPVFIRLNSNGALDNNFGNGGKTYPNIFHPQSSVLFQPDGKIIMADQSYNTNTKEDFWLMRMNYDGTLDNSFGINGEVKTDLGNNEQDIVYKLILQKEGKIMAIGSTKFNTTEGTDFALVRYNSNGTLDTNFGKNGIVTDNISSVDKWADLVIQPDGKILVTGSVNVDSVGKMNFIVARYNENGTLDNSFGDGGKVIIWFNTYTRDIANSIMLQPDGKIVVGGMSGEIFFYNNFALARFNNDGTLDNNFGFNGKVTTKFTDNDASTDMLLAKDDNIILSGYSGSNIAIAKYFSSLNLAVNESNKSTKNIIFFPNPANNALNINLNNNFSQHLDIFIYDCSGHLLKQSNINDDKQIKKINISDLAAGVYFIQCISGNINIINKFIKE
jgi:uncharacterized delta-60 repeat protein